MSLVERAGLAALQRMDPERAHGWALRGLRSGLVPLPGALTSPRLRTDVAGLALDNPLGLAAGFDKNAEALAPLARTGFGFIEVGAATPRPQSGNPKPRLFRLREDAAAINRFGFNNAGMQVIGERLAKRPRHMVLGLNLGANKDSTDRAADFAQVLAHCGPHIDFATVNVSSPNTEKLRDLQGAAALTALLDGVMAIRADLATRVPIFLKIAPDLSDAEIADVARVALHTGIDGIIATNTTLSREGLQSSFADQAGGLSGQPLFNRSTQVLARLAGETGGALPLIGVGGVGSAAQAMAKIKAGASAVQLYTALVYGGLSLVSKIVTELDEILASEGWTHVSDAVGSERGRLAL